MRIAEYKQVGTKTEIRKRWVVEEAFDEAESVGYWEEYAEEVPVMELVYRDATSEEEAEAARQAASIPAPEPSAEERIAELEAQNAMLLECVLEMSEIVYA